MKTKQEKEILKKIKDQQKSKDKQMEALKAEVDVLRPIVKEKFYPLLKDKSISDADIVCQVLDGRIKETFQGLARKIKVSELGLETILVDDELKGLDILKDLTVDQALKIVEGMNQAIMACIRRESKDRKLSDLKELDAEFV